MRPSPIAAVPNAGVSEVEPLLNGLLTPDAPGEGGDRRAGLGDVALEPCVITTLGTELIARMGERDQILVRRPDLDNRRALEVHRSVLDALECEALDRLATEHRLIEVALAALEAQLCHQAFQAVGGEIPVMLV